MKKVALLIAFFLFFCTCAGAQGFLKKLGKTFKDRTTESVEDRAEETVDNAVGKAFDAVNNLLSGKKKNKKGEDDQDEDDEEDSAEPAVWNCPNPECGHTGNTGKFCSECGAKRPASLEASLASGWYASKKVSFHQGSAELKFDSVGELQKIAGVMQKDPSMRLIIQVLYINQEASDEEKALSEDRAENVAKALIGMGCDEFNLKAVDQDYGKDAEGRPSFAGLKGLYTIFIRKDSK